MECFPAICGSGLQRSKLEGSDDWTIEKTQTKLSQALFDPEKHPPEVQEALAFVSEGGNLTKVRSKKSQQNRFFKVENGVMFIYVDSQKKGFQSRVKDQSKVYIQKIQEVQEGMQSSVFTEAFQDSSKPPESSRCFTIVFMGGDRTMDLVAPDESTRTLWVTGLRHLSKFLKEGDPATVRSLFLQHQFQKADVDGNGTLDRTEILRLLKHMNVSVEEEYARDIWQLTTEKISQRKQPGLSAEPLLKKATKDKMTLEEFAVFCDLLEKQEEIDELFRKYDHGTGKLTVDDLSDFWKKEQQEELCTEEIQKMIESCEACPDFKEKLLLSLPGFHAMVRSEWMDACFSRCRTVYQDMDQPLCHYFISSSHNTYLSDDQLKGSSKVDCYTRALKMGCRCVELDAWNGSEGQPVIYHGYTLTSQISFRDVIEAINQHAFETSEFPVILSIENHCSIEQQKIMAEDMRSIFGSKLLIEPLPEGTTRLPSPNELKGRIIVKCKKLPMAAAVPEEEEEEEEVSDEDEAAEMPDEQVKEEVEKTKRTKGSKQKLAQELSDCVVICQSVSFKSFKQAKEKSDFRHISSLDETKALDLVENQSDEFLEHNTWQLSRIYPKGSRMNSGNFYPLPLWRAGCQIIALNCQTHDTPMLMNRGMFEDNGRCGFVLKPEFMRKDPGDGKTTAITASSSALDVSHISLPNVIPFSKTGNNLPIYGLRDSSGQSIAPCYDSASVLYKPNGPYPPEWKRKLTIKVISGYQLPKPVNQKESSVLDPFVKIDICGIPSDIQKGRTKTIDDKGFHPVWKEEFEFVVSCPDLAIVLFRVYDNEEHRKDIIVAQYGLPMNAMATGYRTVHLKTIKGDPLTTGTLFIHVTIAPE